jgi:hypothetical protein
MKLREAIEFVNEEDAGSEELMGKEDLNRFTASLKSKLLAKSFSAEQAQKVVGQFLTELNSSGWLAKIIPDDKTKPDVIVNINGSQVLFTVIADGTGERKTFTYNTVKSDGEYKAPTNVVANQSAQAVHPTNSFQRYANVQQKAGQ